MAINTISLTMGIRKNLFNLMETSELMEQTSRRLGTGNKVNNALDDPVNFFAAQGHLQRASDLAGRKDEMGEAVQLVNAANNGIEAITILIESARSLAQSALSADTTTDVNLLGEQFNTILSQIDTMAADSGYKGINLLNGTTESLTVRFDETGIESNLTLQGFNATSGSTGSGLGISAALTGTGGAWTNIDVPDVGMINTALEDLDNARSTLRAETKKLAANLSTITARQDFTQKMINTLTDGAAELTLADMNEEGANMLMLQTRQALGTTSLSIASQAAQSVLRLF
ncbi:MAG: flagellin [bacterium]